MYVIFSSLRRLRSAFFLNFTQRRMVVCNRGFGPTYRYHLRGSSSQRRIFLGSLTAWRAQISRQKYFILFILFYFFILFDSINAWLLPKSPPGMPLPKLFHLANPRIHNRVYKVRSNTLAMVTVYGLTLAVNSSVTNQWVPAVCSFFKRVILFLWRPKNCLFFW